MNILLVGSGAREHAIARAIAQSPQQTRLFCFGSSRNPGITELAVGYQTGSMTDVNAIVSFAHKHAIDWAIVGPEAPLEAGVVDKLQEVGILSVGPTKQLAQLETSKSFTRDLMQKYQINAFPKFKYFSSIEGVATFLDELGDDYVIKCDGLMGGKGVVVSGEHLHSRHEAHAWCQELLSKGKTFLIEEKLVGQEFSYISLSDGEHLAHTFAIQDHKRVFEGDTGPNTGGMGTYSDANHSLPFLRSEDIESARQINQQVMHALKEECGMPYKGVLYGGFMVTKSGVKVIEYNARFGDPEAMNIFALLETDFVAACQAVIDGTLDQSHIQFSSKATVCKYAVPKGYPTDPVRNEKIDVSAVEDKDRLYFAAVDEKEDGLYETGSRTVAVVGIGDSISAAEEIAEAEVSLIKGPLFHRKDIGTQPLVEKRISHMQSIRS